MELNAVKHKRTEYNEVEQNLMQYNTIEQNRTGPKEKCIRIVNKME